MRRFPVALLLAPVDDRSWPKTRQELAHEVARLRRVKDLADGQALPALFVVRPG